MRGTRDFVLLRPKAGNPDNSPGTIRRQHGVRGRAILTGQSLRRPGVFVEGGNDRAVGMPPEGRLEFVVTRTGAGKVHIENDDLCSRSENFLDHFGIDRARPGKTSAHEGENRGRLYFLGFELGQIQRCFVQGKKDQIPRRGIFQTVPDDGVLQCVFGQFERRERDE